MFRSRGGMLLGTTPCSFGVMGMLLDTAHCPAVLVKCCWTLLTVQQYYGKVVGHCSLVIRGEENVIGHYSVFIRVMEMLFDTAHSPMAVMECCWTLLTVQQQRGNIVRHCSLFNSSMRMLLDTAHCPIVAWECCWTLLTVQQQRGNVVGHCSLFNSSVGMLWDTAHCSIVVWECCGTLQQLWQEVCWILLAVNQGWWECCWKLNTVQQWRWACCWTMFIIQWWLVSQLVGALSPVNHRGLHQGYSVVEMGMSLDAFGWILLARVCNQHPWNLQQNIKKEMLLAGMCILFHADLIVVTESCLSLSTFFMYILTAISVTKSCTLSVCVHVCVCVCMCMHSCVCVCVCVIFL